MGFVKRAAPLLLSSLAGGLALQIEHQPLGCLLPQVSPHFG